jgi:hypothetical protein
MSPRRVVHKPRLYLSRRGKLSIYAVFGATWLSGVGWLIFHYFLPRHGQFGTEPHPLESWSLALHGACAFAMLWLSGWLWKAHVLPWWDTRKRRTSGVVLIFISAVLIASGYLLYYASDDGLRHWSGLVHWSIGLVLVLPLVVHGLRSGRYRAAAGAAPRRS